MLGSIGVQAAFVAGRVRDVDRQVRGELDTLDALLAGGQLPVLLPAPDGSAVLAQVLADDGTVLAATGSASRVQPLPLPRGGPLVLGSSGSSAGVPLRVRARRLRYAGTPVTAVAAVPLGDLTRVVRAFRVLLLVVTPALTGLGALVVWLVTGLALRPVERLRASAATAAAEPLAATALEVPQGDDELGRLGRTLGDLVERLRALLEQQRGFVADAAHELRSPLASLRVQLEVAAAHPAGTSVVELARDLAPEVARLERLVDGLLALARAESATAPRTALDLVPVVREAAGDLARAPRRPVAVVVGDPEALRRAVVNLVANASRCAGRVEVSVDVEHADAVVRVDDDGPGIPVPDRERVFERWVRLDDARTADAGGAGLGLALVRAVARAHGGTVLVTDSPLGGARVELRLPLAAAAGARSP